MPICIECCQPVSQLYTTYSKADDRALGKGVRLTQCPRCKRFADKYVEHDYVVLFIDLILTKPQVYRHLLFNRLWSGDETFDLSLIRLAILIFIIEFYLSWAELEKTDALSKSALADAPVVAHYAFCLLLKISGGIAFHCTVRLLARILVPRHTTSRLPSRRREAIRNSRDSLPSPLPDDSGDNANTSKRPPENVGGGGGGGGGDLFSSPNLNGYLNVTPNSPMTASASVFDDISSVDPACSSPTASRHLEPIPPPPLPTADFITAALVVSSCTKLFPILLVIWPPEEKPAHAPTPTAVQALGSPAPSAVALIPAASSVSVYLRTMGSRLPTYCASLKRSTSALFSTAGLSSLSSSLLSLLFSFVLSITNTHLVLLNNVEALHILLGCNYVHASTMVLGGQIARVGTEKLLLKAVGL